MAEGRWSPLVDAGETRRLLEEMSARGITDRQIYLRAGLGKVTTYRIRKGITPTVHPDTAAAIATLAATLTPSPHAIVNAAGTRRRIHGLLYWGWTTSAIAAETGLPLRTVQRLAANASTVRQHNAERVQRATAALGRRKPPGEPDPRWTPLAAWDDIDNPDERPKGVPGTDTRNKQAVDPEIVARIHRLKSQGLTDLQIAHQVGYRTASAVQKIRTRKREDAA